MSRHTPSHTEGLIPKEGRTMPPGAPPLPRGLPSALRLLAPALQGAERQLQRPAPPCAGALAAPPAPIQAQPQRLAAPGGVRLRRSWGTAQVCSRGCDGTRCLPGPRTGAACKEARTGQVQWAPIRQFGATSGGESSRRRPCWPPVGKGTSLWSEWSRKTSVSLPHSQSLE